jgi:hypothetical protein
LNLPSDTPAAPVARSCPGPFLALHEIDVSRDRRGRVTSAADLGDLARNHEKLGDRFGEIGVGILCADVQAVDLATPAAKLDNRRGRFGDGITELAGGRYRARLGHEGRRGGALLVRQLALGGQLGAHLRALAADKYGRCASFTLKMMDEATDFGHPLRHVVQLGHVRPRLPSLEQIVASQTDKDRQRDRDPEHQPAGDPKVED